LKPDFKDLIHEDFMKKASDTWEVRDKIKRRIKEKSPDEDKSSKSKKKKKKKDLSMSIGKKSMNDS
jgi:hypothetical protein